jgi:tetratricopeptide (TPR) repeat protein
MRCVHRACLIVFLFAGCRDDASRDAQSGSTSKSGDRPIATPSDKSIPFQSDSLTDAFPEWTPSGNQAPEAILSEAKRSLSDGKYEDALEKYTWLLRRYANSDEAHFTSQFALVLRDWQKLADVYPPAKAKLHEIQKKAESSVHSDIDAVASFKEFATVNSVLNEEQKTVVLFKLIDQENVQTAGEAFEAAWPALMKHGELELCSSYVDPKDYQRFAESYQQSIVSAEESTQNSEVESAKALFSKRVTSLIALLVLSDRKNEAETIVREAVVILPENEFADALRHAMEGKFLQPAVNR